MEDLQPQTGNRLHRVADLLRCSDTYANALPLQLPDPEPVRPHDVPLLRTYPARVGGYPFAPRGERSVAHGYTKALQRARRLVYVEDQYLWSREVADTFVQALRAQPGLHLVAVLPHQPDQDGAMSQPPNPVGRDHALSAIVEAGEAGSPFTASRTTSAHRSTSTRRSASSMTSGQPSGRTTSTAASGHTTRS